MCNKLIPAAQNEWSLSLCTYTCTYMLCMCNKLIPAAQNEWILSLCTYTCTYMYVYIYIYIYIYIITHTCIHITLSCEYMRSNYNLSHVPRLEIRHIASNKIMFNSLQKYLSYFIAQEREHTTCENTYTNASFKGNVCTSLDRVRRHSRISGCLLDIQGSFRLKPVINSSSCNRARQIYQSMSHRSTCERI